MSKHFLLLFLPLILSNVIHMVVVKFDYLPSLKIPLHARLFGKNKTYRGFFVASILNSLFFVGVLRLYGPSTSLDFIFGALIGFTYMAFELPNSYFKRRMGIRPGESSQGPLTIIMDKTDSALGVTLTYCLLIHLTVSHFAQLFLSAFIIHSLFSFLLVKVRIKERF